MLGFWSSLLPSFSLRASGARQTADLLLESIGLHLRQALMLGHGAIEIEEDEGRHVGCSVLYLGELAGQFTLRGHVGFDLGAVCRTCKLLEGLAENSKLALSTESVRAGSSGRRGWQLWFSNGHGDPPPTLEQFDHLMKVARSSLGML